MPFYEGPVFSGDDDPWVGPINDPQTLFYKYQWRTRGQNCDMCNALDGRVYKMDRWFSSGLMPGFHLNCDCYLKLVGKIEGPGSDIPESDLDIFGDMNLYGDNIFGGLLDPSWQPYNVLFTDQITGLAEQGYSLQEAFNHLLGEFGAQANNLLSGIYSDFMQWSVFAQLQNFFNANNNIITTPYNPLPANPLPNLPVNTNNNPFDGVEGNATPGHPNTTINSNHPGGFCEGW